MFQVYVFFLSQKGKTEKKNIYDCNRNKIVKRGWVTGAYCIVIGL